MEGGQGGQHPLGVSDLSVRPRPASPVFATGIREVMKKASLRVSIEPLPNIPLQAVRQGRKALRAGMGTARSPRSLQAMCRNAS